MKKVYIAMSADVIHHGHMALIEKASKLGEVTVGVLSDEAVATYKRYPLLNLEQRMKVAENIKNVSCVVVQNGISYEENLRKLKPDYVVHGDDWKNGIQKNIRSAVIDILNEWGGELIEYPYTQDIETNVLRDEINKKAILPEIRRSRLAHILKNKGFVNVMEAHNGLTGLIVENAKFAKEDKIESFDAIWISSLCDSTAKGKPDTELVDLTSRLNTINEIMEVTTKPIILDGDSGGLTEHFVFNVKTLERQGVSAIIIEDKIGSKRNSLFGTEAEQQQDTIENFCEKIIAGKKALQSRDFMIIARIESLILEQGMDDAIKRAKAYVQAGVSGIMIHSCKKTPNEVFEFCDKFNEFAKDIPLVVVPTTYNTVTTDELRQKGVNIVIHANHLIRSAFPAMMKTAESILEHNRSYESDDMCMPIKQILNLVPNS